MNMWGAIAKIVGAAISTAGTIYAAKKTSKAAEEQALATKAATESQRSEYNRLISTAQTAADKKSEELKKQSILLEQDIAAKEAEKKKAEEQANARKAKGRRALILRGGRRERPSSHRGIPSPGVGTGGNWGDWSKTGDHCVIGPE